MNYMLGLITGIAVILAVGALYEEKQMRDLEKELDDIFKFDTNTWEDMGGSADGL